MHSFRQPLLKQIIEGEIKWDIKVTGRRGRRCRKLLDDLKERRDLQIALCGELALEEVLDLSSDRLLNESMYFYTDRHFGH